MDQAGPARPRSPSSTRYPHREMLSVIGRPGTLDWPAREPFFPGNGLLGGEPSPAPPHPRRSPSPIVSRMVVGHGGLIMWMASSSHRPRHRQRHVGAIIARPTSTLSSTFQPRRGRGGGGDNTQNYGGLPCRALAGQGPSARLNGNLQAPRALW